MFKSILDNDLYKFTMQNAVCRLYPRASVLYTFTDRDKILFPPDFAAELHKRVQKMVKLAMTREEYLFMKDSCSFLDPAYLDFLMGFRYDPKEVVIEQKEGKLDLKIQGPWYRTILWEVPLLAMISELYFELSGKKVSSHKIVSGRIEEKGRRLRQIGAAFSDFGTRRRYSYDNHCQVVKELKESGKGVFQGTSNVHLAHKYDLRPVGTMAHEWIMFHAANFGYLLANSIALERWAEIYQGELGIALSDTYTTEVFLRNYSAKLAKLYDGVRQDSGDPIDFANKMIEHYRKLRVDPKSKTIVFSDSLNIDAVDRIHSFCQNEIKDLYGIGTYLTNDVGVTPLNIVIKLFSCRLDTTAPGLNTIKLSDDPGKSMGDPDEVRICKDTLKQKACPLH